MDFQKMKFPLVALGCVTFLATQPGASCVDTTTTTDGKTTSQHRVDPNWNDGDSTNDSQSAPDPNYIPRRAEIVMEGKGLLEYTVDADGQMWVQDLKNETTVITRRAHRGEKISVSPDDNRVKLDEDTISKTDLKSDHTHRIYLLRDSRFNDDRGDRDWNRDRDGNRDRDNGPTYGAKTYNYDARNIHINSKDVGPYNEHGVPAKARMMDQGLNREMTFVSDKSGRVYIFDVQHDQVAATVDIDARQAFTFSPGADKVSVDGKHVLSCDFDPTSQYRIYFNH